VSRRLRCAVLLSGSGRTLENLLARRDAGSLPVEVVAVASNKPGVRGLEIAAAAGLPHAVFPRREHTSAAARDAPVVAFLDRHDPEVFVLAGYLALLHL